MSKRLFWIAYVSMVLLGGAAFNALDPAEPPATNLAEFIAQSVGAGFVFGALGAVIGFVIAWYRVRPEPVASIPKDKLRRNVLLATLAVLVLMLLYTAGTRMPLG